MSNFKVDGLITCPTAYVAITSAPEPLLSNKVDCTSESQSTRVHNTEMAAELMVLVEGTQAVCHRTEIVLVQATVKAQQKCSMSVLIRRVSAALVLALVRHPPPPQRVTRSCSSVQVRCPGICSFWLGRIGLPRSELSWLPSESTEIELLGVHVRSVRLTTTRSTGGMS